MGTIEDDAQSDGFGKVRKPAVRELTSDHHVELHANGSLPIKLVLPLELELQATEGSFVMPSRRAWNDPSTENFDPEEFLEELTKDVRLIQREKLREILAHNADVEYLRRHGLDGNTAVESFKKHVPIVSYEDLETDILRLVNGEATHIFSVDPISHFSLSSGTTAGKSKYIPTNMSKAFGNFPFREALGVSLRKREFETLKLKPGKSVSINFPGMQIDTPSGIKAGAVTTNYYKSPLYRERKYNINNVHVSPDEVVLCSDSSQAMYCHLLCALCEAQEITRLETVFAVTVVSVVRALQKCWPEICEDIRTGTLNSKITDPAVRNAVGKILKPNPVLASLIEKECLVDEWEAIIPRLWRNICYISCIFTGSMQQYVPALKHFAGPNVHLMSNAYGAAECLCIGVNVSPSCAPEDTSYLVWPEEAFFEFIALNSEGNALEPQIPVELADVVLGHEYELVVTNGTGLYRYRVGDVVRVKSFRNTAPILEFVRRKNVLLSINSDKTDEQELQIIVNKATQHFAGTSLKLADFTSHADITSAPGHYVIFWELESSSDDKNLDHEVLQKCTNALDVSLNYPYRRARVGDTIGPLELRVVGSGTFNKLMDMAISRGTSPAQYKPPRCVSAPHLMEILNAAVAARFYSLETPFALPPSAAA